MKKFYLLLVSSIVITLSSFSQVIPANILNRINNSEYIFEGKIIRSDGYWNDDKSFIFTSFTIDISKIFKGNLVCGKVELILDGGKVADSVYLKVYHNIELGLGAKGIFLCNITIKEHPVVDYFLEENNQVLETYSNEQGFIKYNEDGINKLINDYQFSLDSLADAYNLLELYTQINYVDCYPVSAPL